MKILKLAIALLFVMSFAGIASADTGTVMVMKHICNDEVQSQEDFDALGSFVDKVVACPTVLMPGDSAPNGAVTLPPQTYNFLVVDDNNELYQIDRAAFMPTKVCESDVESDINGDGTVSSTTCLDTSHYVFHDIEFGDVTVIEQRAPDKSRAGALQFTPSAIDGNNDAESLVDFAGEVIELNTAPDEDNMIMLHIYNFRNMEASEKQANIVAKELSPGKFAFTCEAPFDVDSVDWNFGDGDKLLDTDESTIQHVYAEDGMYEVTCTAARLNLSADGYEKVMVEINEEAVMLSTTLSGSNEVPPIESVASGLAQATILGNTIDITGSFQDLEGAPIVVAGSEAHLHLGAKDENGPVVFLLDVSFDTGEGVFSLTSDITDEQKQAFLNGGYYVNLHTDAFPAGELRGQLEVVDAGDSPVTVMVMKHVCGEHIQSIEDFEALEEGRSPAAALANTVVNCPTVGLVGDEASPGTLAAPRADFDFSVLAPNQFQTIDDSTYAQRAVCESDLGVDADGNGEISEDTCLDVSHYEYYQNAPGLTTVTETQPPQGFEFGTLRFTPSEVAPNNDAQSLISAENGVIELDTAVDSDGMIMLHVYNFQTQNTAELSVKEFYPQGLDYVFVCDAGFDATEYTYFFGDGSAQYGSALNNVFHRYSAPGEYTVTCYAEDGDESFTEMLMIQASSE